MVAAAGGEARYFEHDGQRLAYTDYGSGDVPFVLLHGQLLSQYMHMPLAKALAARGHRVVTLDLLGHGASERPPDLWRYSMTRFAEQVVGLLDHLEVQRAIVGGTSLGANVSLEFGAVAPGRAEALVVEMPVLDAGVYGAVIAFTPLLSWLMFGQPMVQLTGRLARLVPRSALPFLGNVMLDTLRQDHRSSAAILQGLFLGRIAPPPEVRRALPMPVLVIGHRHDPIHPHADAVMLAGEAPRARLVEATSILELRLHPERLTDEIGRFLDEVTSEASSTLRAGRNDRRRAAAASTRPRRRPSPSRRKPRRPVTASSGGR
ncbi:MAG: alpha/beta fold hydrolase [Candidatus Dormibacteria bacterium]